MILKRNLQIKAKWLFQAIELRTESQKKGKLGAIPHKTSVSRNRITFQRRKTLENLTKMSTSNKLKAINKQKLRIRPTARRKKTRQQRKKAQRRAKNSLIGSGRSRTPIWIIVMIRPTLSQMMKTKRIAIIGRTTISSSLLKTPKSAIKPSMETITHYWVSQAKPNNS